MILQTGDQIDEMVGSPSFTVPPECIHVVPAEKWPQDLEETGGVFNFDREQILVKETDSRLHFAAIAFHEYMHLKSFGKLRVTEDGRLTDARVGLGVFNHREEKEYFALIDEAITEELTKSFIQSYKDHELFAEETRITDELRRRYGSQDDARKYFNEDLYYAKDNGVNEDGTADLHLEAFTYTRERGAVNQLISKIVERNQLENYSTEDLQRLFISGYITGNILPLGRIIDSTFGVGTFRAIGTIEDPDQLVEFIDSL